MTRFACLLLALAVLLCGCQGETQYEHTTFAMDTVISLELWGRDGQTAALEIESMLRALESTWSATAEDSVLSRLNRGESGLSEEEQALLDRAEALRRRTGGAFDPYLGGVSRVWGFYDGENQQEDFILPTQEQISDALEKKQWDLGAVIKGCAGTLGAAMLEEYRVERAILNLGGNIQTYGEKPDGTPWQIGIQNPDGGDYLGILEVRGTMAIVTSGDYQRYFEKDGIRYHHILNPETGYPADSGLRSVTVICEDGMTADALSTALFVMGLEEGGEFWRGSDDFQAVFVTEEGKIYATEGAALTGCEYEVIYR